MMQHNILLEIGTEELPASFIRHALQCMDEESKNFSLKQDLAIQRYELWAHREGLHY